MKFDSLEAVLLGDEAWACELTMDELAFVGGGYGSGYGSAVPAAPAGPQTTAELENWFASNAQREQAQGVNLPFTPIKTTVNGQTTFSIGGGGYQPSSQAPYVPPCPQGWTWDGGNLVASTNSTTGTYGQIGTDSWWGANNSNSVAYQWGCRPSGSGSSSSSGYGG
jgi:hypothetical protein